VPPKPGEEPTEDGDGGAEEHGSKDEEEDEELEGKRGANEGEEKEKGVRMSFPLSFPWVEIRVTCRYFLFFSFLFPLGRARRGQGELPRAASGL